MRAATIRMSRIAVIVLAFITCTVKGASGPSQIANVEQETRGGHLSGLMARVTLPDGSSRTVKLEGVGCSRSICSRVVIKGYGEGGSQVQKWLDSIETIKDTTEGDAFFVLKDGTQQRLSLVHDFRVLYIANRSGGTEKLDLAKVKSLEFVAPVRSR